MEAKEVIVAQAIANAELMAERDALREEVLTLRGALQHLSEQQAEEAMDKEE